MIVQGRTLDSNVEDSADVVVVGSGSGGAVVAAHLAEAGKRVVVVEAGPHVPWERYGRMRPSESMRHLWQDGGLTLAFGIGNSPTINVMMGHCVGGSSVLTGGVCFRTPGSVHEHWARNLGLSELSEAAMEPFYEDVERAVHVEEVPESARSKSTALFALGSERLGRPVRALRRNTKGCRGCGRCNFGCPEGAKLSVDLTYLPRAAKCGAVIYSDFSVERVLTRGAHAAGVTGRILSGENRRPVHRFTVHAERVVIAAGAYATPLILERTGVGKQSGELGKNLTLHPAFRMMGHFDDRVEGWKGALQSAYCHAYEHEGINLVGLFVPPGVLTAVLPGVGDEHHRHAAWIPHLAVFGGMIHDEGGGRVHHVLGKRFLTYRMSPKDSAAVSRTLSLLAETYFAAGAKEVCLPILGMAPLDADAFRRLDLDRVPRPRLECTSQHPLGTARLGVSAEHAVVDADGRSFELEGLYVADGSVFPTSLGVNPQESILAMATRIAWKLRERPRA